MIRLDLPFTKPPLTANQRLHHMARHRLNRQIIDTVQVAVRAQVTERIPLDAYPLDLTLHYQAPDKRRRDPDNLAPTLKAAQDGLVKAGLLPDDSWLYIRRPGCQIHAYEPGQLGALWLTLTDPKEN